MTDGLAREKDGPIAKRKKMSHDTRVVIMALLAGLPAVLLSMIVLWTEDFTPKVEWTLTLLVLGFWLGFSFSLRTRVVRPLQTISNLLAALREGDFSIRARGGTRLDTLDEVVAEVNALGATLKEQRLGALEAIQLLKKVMEEIDVAVFTFDGGQTLRLVNRAGERLLALPRERLAGRSAIELGLAECLAGPDSRVLDVSFPGGSGRWEMRRTVFREAGLPHQLLVLSDLSRALREEERQAWKRLIRVLGHELNNSLAPIRSIATSLDRLLMRDTLPADWLDDMHKGLAVIASRGESLSRFMAGYSRLAHLPPPRLQWLPVSDWIARVARLETRMEVTVVPGPEMTIRADGDQLDQLLINLVRNGVDAALQVGGQVRMGWSRSNRNLEVWVDDGGPGLSDTGNLFVPFFTTKPFGSGIGLVLSRQIAEAHGGGLTLENKPDSRGCIARLKLPLQPQEA